jgi:hypothetical protein
MWNEQCHKEAVENFAHLLKEESKKLEKAKELWDSPSYGYYTPFHKQTLVAMQNQAVPRDYIENYIGQCVCQMGEQSELEVDSFSSSECGQQ